MSRSHRFCALPRTLLLIGLVTGTSLLGGCSGGSGPETIAVQGKVTYEGQPVETGRIIFQPVAGDTPGRTAIGELKTGGVYQLSSYSENDGAVPGEYKVIIESYTGGPSPEEPNAKQTWLIPEKYGNPVQSDLTASVPSDAAEPLEINFDLE